MGRDSNSEFETRDAVPSLAADEIHVWSMHLDPTLDRSQIGAAAQSTLLRLLCCYGGRTRAPAIERGAHGKPFAPELPDLDFNLSHAGHGLLFAFARGLAVGVDLERIDRRLSVDAIAGRFFAPSESRALATLEPVRRREVFLRLWTHKEAVLKAVGHGLGFGLDRVEFSIVANDIGRLHHIAPEAGVAPIRHVHRCDPDSASFGAVAWRGGPRRVRCFAWPH